MQTSQPMGKYFVELRNECDRTGPPRLALIENIDDHMNQSNFRSTYMYDWEVAASIESNGHTRGLKGKSVASNVLFIDVDEDKNVPLVCQKLKDCNVNFYIYHTGNRGMHFHIPIEWMEGENVIYSQIKWLKGAGIWELIDHSIYREGGQYRREGAIHGTTRKAKEFFQGYTGEGILTIPILVAPPEVAEPFCEEEGDSVNMQIFLMNCMQKRSEGGRHSHFYILWQSGKRAGLDQESIKEMILWWNYQQETPHRSSVVEDKLRRFK